MSPVSHTGNLNGLAWTPHLSILTWGQCIIHCGFLTNQKYQLTWQLSDSLLSFLGQGRLLRSHGGSMVKRWVILLHYGDSKVLKRHFVSIKRIFESKHETTWNQCHFIGFNLDLSGFLDKNRKIPLATIKAYKCSTDYIMSFLPFSSSHGNL